MQIPDEIVAALVMAISAVIGYGVKYVTGRGNIDLANRQHDIDRDAFIMKLIHEIQDENQQLRIENATLRNRIDSMENKLNEMTDELRSLREVDLAQARETIDKQRSRISELLNENQALTQRLIDCETNDSQKENE